MATTTTPTTAAATHESPTALIPIADGSEEIEAITLADVLVRGGVKARCVTLASVGRKHENIVTMSRGVKVQADMAIEACVDLGFDLIVVPGGMPGANYLRDSEVLVELLKQQKHDGKLYGAICAAPAAVLYSHGLLPSPWTGYPGSEKQVTGGNAHSTERVVVSDNCVTSRGPGTAMEMGVKLVELLSGKEKADQVAKALLLM